MSKPLCFVALVAALCLAGCRKVPARANAAALTQASAQAGFFQMVDALDGGFSYAYAPSIIVKDGVYHVFFCSKGWLTYPAWDSIRHVTSTDGQTWSQPQVVLQATASNGNDMAACDPSLVFYDGYYYLFYSSAITTAPQTYQTVVQVARSTAISGPYLTYTQRKTWENTPTDPQVLIYPLQLHNTQPAGYGAGQTSVIVRNGELLMWYTDDTLFVDGQPQVRTYLLKSTNPVSWSPSASAATSLVGQASIDVKYDSAHAQFVMVRVENEFSATSYLASASSGDGVNWTPLQTVFPASEFPVYSHDGGMAGDENGNLITPNTLVGFGAPYNLANVNNWGQWNLYGAYVDSSLSDGAALKSRPREK